MTWQKSAFYYVFSQILIHFLNSFKTGGGRDQLRLLPCSFLVGAAEGCETHAAPSRTI